MTMQTDGRGNRTVTVEADGEEKVLSYTDFSDYKVRVTFVGEEVTPEGKVSVRTVNLFRSDGIEGRDDITKDVIQEAVDKALNGYEVVEVHSIRVVEETDIRRGLFDTGDE